MIVMRNAAKLEALLKDMLVYIQLNESSQEKLFPDMNERILETQEDVKQYIEWTNREPCYNATPGPFL
jgi:hypothetical protein